MKVNIKRSSQKIDLFGPLPSSKYGFQYIFVILAAFTKLVKLYGMRRATTTACLNKVLNHYIPAYGKPVKIVFDNGSQFTSRKRSEALQTREIKQFMP